MKIISPTFLLPLLLMLESSSGRVDINRDIKNLIWDHCNTKYTFAVVVVANRYLGNTFLFSIYACTGVLVSANIVVTTGSCYYRNEGTDNFEEPQDITVIVGFDKKYAAKAHVLRVFPPFDEYPGNIDSALVLDLDAPFRPSPGVNIVKRGWEGLADTCKHAELVSAVVIHETKLNAQGTPKIVDVHVHCSPVKVIEQSVCTNLWPWVPPTLSWCGQTKPRYWLDGFHLDTESLICYQALGSPLLCDGVLIGLQGHCARHHEVNTSFIKIDTYLKHIDYYVRITRFTRGKNKTRTGKSASNGADFFDGTYWWKMAAGIGAVLFVYF